jgi:NAD(P)-dependent dehydrogenase (short-subunit alcohol dehydrogenase family)
MSELRLKDRVAVVTGGASGMGRASAKKFVAEGAHVVIADVDELAAAAVAAELSASGPGSARAYALDVTDLSRLRGLVELVEREFGILHVLFNNAGYPGPAGLDAVTDEFDKTVDINVKAGYYATSYAIPLLTKAVPHASVIFTSSTSGVVGSPLSVLYSAAKGAVVLMAKSMALSLGGQGIRVNVICPGPTDTPMLPRFFGRETSEGLSDKIDGFVQASIPLQRLATSEDVAGAAVFLASDESSFVTGVALPVDGGYLAR